MSALAPGESTAAPSSGGLAASSIKSRIEDGIVALSLGNLWFIRSWSRLFSDADYGFYNKIEVTTATLMAVAVNILIFAFLAWLVMGVRRRSQSRVLHLVINWAFLASMWIPATFVRMLLDPQRIHTAFLYRPTWLLILAVCALIAAWKHRWSARIAAGIVGILSPLAFFTLARIVLVSLGLMHLKGDFREPTFPPPVPMAKDQPRVIWFIFDEMDYRLVFAQRPPGLQMPEIDRLRENAFFAVNAHAPTDKTIFSMPSLISGQRVLSASFTNGSDLALKLADTGEVTTWKKLPSVFSSAKALGVNTALVGWHIPYARILGENLNYCACYPNPGFEPTRSKTFAVALWRQFTLLAAPFHFQRDYVNLHASLLRDSLSVATNATYGLVFFHMFPPHLPGIYLPGRDQFSVLGQSPPGGYFNNLALLDRDVGKLRKAMTEVGLWDKTWLIVSADHSWRGSQVYDGIRDMRVPFLVKPPDSASSEVYSNEFNTVCTGNLVLAILRKEVQNETDVAAWLDKHASNAPTVTDLPGTNVE